MPPQPSLNLIPTIQQAITSLLTDVRAGVPAVRLPPVHRRSPPS